MRYIPASEVSHREDNVICSTLASDQGQMRGWEGDTGTTSLRVTDFPGNRLGAPPGQAMSRYSGRVRGEARSLISQVTNMSTSHPGRQQSFVMLQLENKRCCSKWENIQWSSYWDDICWCFEWENMRECSVSEKMPHMRNSAALQEMIKRGARNESICNTDMHQTIYSYILHKTIYSTAQIRAYTVLLNIRKYLVIQD